MYNKRIFTPVIYSHYIRSYYLGELGIYPKFSYDGLLTVAPNNYEGYSEDKYTFKNLMRNYDPNNSPKSDFSLFYQL